MTNGKLISTQAIIAKVIADNGLNEDQIEITNMAEWVGEAIEKIGAVTQLDKKNKVLKIKDYQVKIPCDLHQINQVAYSRNDSTSAGKFSPMLKQTANFDVSWTKSSKSIDPYVHDERMLQMVKNMYNLVNDRDALDILNSDDNLKKTLTTLIQKASGQFGKISHTTTDLNQSNQYEYYIKPGYIVTNQRDGYISISYMSIPTDEAGLPLIPDMASYSEAIYWYITLKMKFKEYMSGELPRYIYHDIRSQWAFYRGQAYAEAMMPMEDDLQTINHVWNKLIPEINHHDSFMSGLTDQQIKYERNKIMR